MSLDSSTFIITEETDDLLRITVTSEMDSGLSNYTASDVIRLSREMARPLINAIQYCLSEGFERILDAPGSEHRDGPAPNDVAHLPEWRANLCGRDHRQLRREGRDT